MESNEFPLIQLQNWMQCMLVSHMPVADGINSKKVMVIDVVNASQKLSAVGHLNIYRHSYIARLRVCMHNQFSALAFALGKELFESFADQYLDTYPSESYTLNTLGEKFPLFLKDTRPDANHKQKEAWPDFMIELAMFEYDLSVIFDSHTQDNFEIASFDTNDDLLKLAPVIQLFQHQFPICDYYLQFTQQKEPELPFSENTYCAVVRQNYKLRLFKILAAQYHFLVSMKCGMSIEEAKINLIKNFYFTRVEFDLIWLKWKKYFIEAGFFVVFF